MTGAPAARAATVGHGATTSGGASNRSPPPPPELPQQQQHVRHAVSSGAKLLNWLSDRLDVAPADEPKSNDAAAVRAAARSVWDAPPPARRGAKQQPPPPLAAKRWADAKARAARANAAASSGHHDAPHGFLGPPADAKTPRWTGDDSDGRHMLVHPVRAAPLQGVKDAGGGAAEATTAGFMALAVVLAMLVLALARAMYLE
ncbi:hypothetical protein HK405_010557, partial [Cladochytrium tenue]